jgi:hypothetical protein
LIGNRPDYAAPTGLKWFALEVLQICRAYRRWKWGIYYREIHEIHKLNIIRQTGRKVCTGPKWCDEAMDELVLPDGQPSRTSAWQIGMAHQLAGTLGPPV